MGKLINGKWQTTDVRNDGKSKDGSFQRSDVSFRESISQEGPFTPDSGRYHLYVSYACPWARRTLITRQLCGLESHIGVSSVSPIMLDDGWTFTNDHDQKANDAVFACEFLREIYLKADSNFTGKVTVPVLWDLKTKTIVNNESADIIRFFAEEFRDLTGVVVDLRPSALRLDLDEWNTKIYKDINNGVYRCGFATSQEAYNRAFDSLSKALDEVEAHLANGPYFFGDSLTETDIRLFTTLVRFDPVYYVHFKCNARLIAQYPNLSRYLCELLKIDAFANTTEMDHIKTHYYFSHRELNPTQIVARGPIEHFE